jgi:hypothetical protein
MTVTDRRGRSAARGGATALRMGIAGPAEMFARAAQEGGNRPPFGRRCGIRIHLKTDAMEILKGVRWAVGKICEAELENRSHCTWCRWGQRDGMYEQNACLKPVERVGFIGAE